MKLNNNEISNKRSVSWWGDCFSSFVERYCGFFKLIGNFESRIFKDELEGYKIVKPVYICGLARSGSTILLELISSNPQIATHRYRDFPLVSVPVWWNWFVDHAGREESSAVERFHKDRILITKESPEAMEEIIWKAFFPGCHNSTQSNILDRETSNPGFEKFYLDHIKKILFVRNGSRYVAKGNYNLTRMPYLKKLFPDSRFLITVREPVGHIASLMKQHRLFCSTENKDRRILNYMSRSGHYEFGLNLQLINTGNSTIISEIENLLKRGEDVKGWARYWATIYEFLAEMLENYKEVRRSSVVVNYDELCRSPLENLDLIYSHCQIKVEAEDLCQQSERLSLPSYYQIPFSEQEISIIYSETDHVKKRIKQFCYDGKDDLFQKNKLFKPIKPK